MPKPKLFTCSLWYPSADSLHLEADESLVSNVIELTCDDSEGVKFSGITVALSHSAVYTGGYELVMKELTGPENNTWKTLNTTSVSLDPSGMLLLIDQIGKEKTSMRSLFKSVGDTKVSRKY